MSVDPDKDAACPKSDTVLGSAESNSLAGESDQKKKNRSVRFPNENQLVTEYFAPANPWQDVPATSRAQLAQDYLLSCRRHNTAPIDSVLQQIREFPEASIGGGARAGRLTLADCSLEGAAPADALESLLRKVQFRRIELDHADLDDEGAEAMFDMIEYYESTCVISITGPRQFGIRGWQAASRMIKKSAELSEIEVAESALEPSHAPVLARALRPHTCRLRALCLQQAGLSGEALMCLVIALKSNGSIRELRLPDNSLTPHDAQQLASLLRFNTNIQLLDLSNNQIQDTGVGHITDALVEQAAQTPPSAATSPISPQFYPLSGMDCRGLAFLVLWNNQLTRNCAQHLSKALRSSHSLCVLNIGRNALGTDAVRALQSGATHGGALLSLGLQCARLGPDAGAPLADLVKADTKLQRLDLRDNRLGPAGLQALLTAMKKNHTLTQIDLDDPVESSTLTEDSEAATVARLTRDIRATCRRNEPPATEPEKRVHRKISLTCHTACVLKNSSVSSARRGARLRSPLPSPAPSPAGSPTPHHQHNIQVNRFSVTRVTPERESFTDSSSPGTPTRPSFPSPSRFKVMQVSEPPSIQVHPAQKRAVSRFSVTRNYDSIYNPSPRESPSASPTPSISSPSPSVSPCPSDASYTDSPNSERVCTESPRIEKSESTRTEKGYMDSPRPEKGYTDSPRPEKGYTDSPRTEKGYTDSPKPDKGYTDSPRPEKGYTDSPRPDKGYTDSPRPEKGYTDSPRPEKGYTDSPRPDKGYTDGPRPEKGYTDSHRTEIVYTVSLIPQKGYADSSRPEKVYTESPRIENSDSTKTKMSHSESTRIEKGYTDSSRTEKGYTNRPKTEKSRSETKIDITYSESPEKSCIYDPRIEKTQIESPKAEKANTDHSKTIQGYTEKQTSIPKSNLPSCSRDIQKDAIDNSSSADISRVSYENVMTDVPTNTFSNTSSYRYDPSITTLSGALFSQSVPEMSVKVSSNNNTADILASQNRIKNSPIPIINSRSEPIFGPALFVEPSVAPTAVPNSRFSISPSPVNFISLENTFRWDVTNIESVASHNIPGFDLGRLNENDDINKDEVNEENSMNKGIIDEIKVNNQNEDGYVETSIHKPVDQKVLPVAACDVGSVATDVAGYAGIQNVSTGIVIHKDLTEKVDVIKKISKEIDQNIFKMDCIPEMRPEESQTDVKTTSIANESSDKLSKDIENASKVTCDAILSKDTKNLPEIHDLIPKDGVNDTAKFISKEFEEKPVILGKVSHKTVDFAWKPEEVILYLSDEPAYGDKEVQNIDVKEKDAGLIDAIATKVAGVSDVIATKVAEKTYSDVVKTEPYKDKVEHLTYEQKIDDVAIKTETKLDKSSVEVNDSDRVDVNVKVTVKTESVKDNAAKVHSDKDFVNIDDIIIRKDDRAMKKIEAITEDLGNLIKDMRVMSSKSKKKCTVDLSSVDTNIVPGIYNRDVVLKKNKSESSLDSPDMEVSRLMNKIVGSPFRDSNSSLEISGSSMESLNAEIPKPIIIQESLESELDRRKVIQPLSTESSVESTSDVTPVNSQNFLNTSVSSNESVSPIIFGKSKKLHGSLSSLEASVSSLDSKQDKVMVTSADSGIEHSIQNASENKDDASSNEGTLTHNSSLRETVKRTEGIQETLTSSPKRTSSLLDVPALKNKGLDRMRKISWVAPSPSFHIPREPEKVKEEKPSHLEKLLSLFQHPTSLFSRSQSDDERKSASNTPPRKDSSLTSSFWSWGSAIENYKEDKDDSSEATDSTLSERVQVSFVDESFSKKLDSKTPSTETDNTLSEYQSSQNTEEKITNTTDLLVQKLDLSLKESTEHKASDNTDLNIPNEDTNENAKEVRLEQVRPRSFAAVLKASGSENSLEKQPSPEAGQLVDKLPVKVIRGIKENISPENTLTSSMTNTQALVEMTAKHPIVNAREIPQPLLDKTEPKVEAAKSDLAPIATIEETCDIAADNFSSETIQLAYIDDVKVDIEVRTNDQTPFQTDEENTVRELQVVDLGKDALSYLMYEGPDFEPDLEQGVNTKVEEGSLAQELQEAAIKEMIDLSPELVIDEAVEVFPAKEKPISPIIPERAKIKKANSLEDLSQRQEKEKSPKAKTIAFKVPETSPRDIPERRTKLRSRSGTSPKSLPESLNKPCPLTKMDSILSKKKKRISSLGKMARDSLLALNMSDEEIAEFRRSYKLTSVESLRSLESVSEDANSQSGTSFDSRCRACIRTSQESLMSLDSITEDCKCERSGNDREKRIV